MAPTRRTLLHALGATAMASLAGCGADDFAGADDSATEYALDVDELRASPVEHALYTPAADALFGDPARTALDAILPDGRHTTYGYEPLPSDAYVEHDGRYYQTKHVVTGRTEMRRTLVRATPVTDEHIPEDAVLVDSLDRPSARTLKILHSYTQTDGKTSTAELLRDDAYVLRRPAELESALASGELDGRVVSMTESGAWAYRVRVTRERIVETAHTAFAAEVATSRPGFRDVVFGSRIDAELSPTTLDSAVRDVLERAVSRGTYTESTPLSEPYESLLDTLGLGPVDTAATGKLLWYDGDLYRYALYVSEGA